ncbi:MAG: alpha/beta hydrolase [Holophagaceae bacterium]|nr:alpha/beta hydrolase [Holophagaceae bacterium]
MPVEDVGGLKTHLQTLGASGPGVVLVHGMLIGSIASWYFSIAPMLALKRRVLMYDLRGHGLTERTPSGYGLRAMAEDLHTLVRRHGGGAPVALVGHSYGAVIALRFALDHPELVTRLVIVEAPLPILTREHVDSVSGLDGEAVVQMMPPWQQHAFLTGGRRARRLGERGIALLRDTTLVDELLAEADFADAELRAFSRPVLLCYGTQTGERMTVTRDRLLQVLPDVRLETIDASHYMTRDAPVPLADAIGRFLDA